MPVGVSWLRAALGIVAIAVAAPAWPGSLPPRVLAKIDRRLLPWATAASGESRAVWVEFRDKGSRSPAELAQSLAAAEASLAPRARARRLRAGVWPLVDERDLAVAPRYLEALTARGMPPIAVSRWLNRAAIRIRADRLPDVGDLDGVTRLAPVERAIRISESQPSPLAPAPRPRGAAPETDPIPRGMEYGMTFDQLEQMRVPAVHACGYTGSGVLVCVLDEGFNQYDRHEALRDQRIAPGRTRDFVQGDTIVTDSSSFVTRHGTWVLGCLAGKKFGTYVGAAYGAEFALARTENGSSETPAEMLYWGMGAEWADSLGADIISSSVGYFQFNDPQFDYGYQDMDGQTTDVTRAARIAAAKGILVVNAVGNEGNSPWRYLIAPADVSGDSLIAVGAVDAFGDTASFSSAGPTADGRIKPDLVARGVSNPLVSTSGDPLAYTTNSGTSFAAPLVAGLAACVMEAHPEWSPVQVIAALRASGSRAGRPDNKVGYGIPNGLLALHGTSPSPAERPRTFRLTLAGGNPVTTGTARLSFTVDDPSLEPFEGRLRVLDAMGRPLVTIWSGLLCFGRNVTASWEGTRADGTRAAPGVYFLALEGGGHLRALRIVSLR